MTLQITEKRALLSLARETITAYIISGKRLKQSFDTPGLNQKAGAFVTLHKDGQLRGCIGTFTSEQPLFETIIEMAISAAARDPRFNPVRRREIIDLDIEISVLSPLREISDISEIEVGRHGIYITRGYNRGVLLPQVATEYGWTREEFLTHTCQKAGLPKDQWRRGDLTIEVFSAEIFSEEG